MERRGSLQLEITFFFFLRGYSLFRWLLRKNNVLSGVASNGRQAITQENNDRFGKYALQ